MKSNIIGNHEMDDLIFQTKSYMFREKTQSLWKLLNDITFRRYATYYKNSKKYI